MTSFFFSFFKWMGHFFPFSYVISYYTFNMCCHFYIHTYTYTIYMKWECMRRLKEKFFFHRPAIVGRMRADTSTSQTLSLWMNKQMRKKGRIWQTHSQRSQVPFGIFADTNNVFAMSSYLWNWKEYEHDTTRHFHFHLRTLFFAPVQLMLVCAWAFFVFLNESQCNMLRQSSFKNKRRHNFGVCKNGWNVSFCGNNRYNFRFLNK